MTSTSAGPDPTGHFGPYGGRLVPEALGVAVDQLDAKWPNAQADPSFHAELGQLLGAEVVPGDVGSRTLKDAINEAMRDWVTNVETTHYLLGTVAGPHPFPVLVRDLQRVIGVEARSQVLEIAGRVPDAVAACVGGGSNAIGIFHAFVDDVDVRLCGFEAGGEGLDSGRHAATLVRGQPGVLHGARSYLLQNADGQTLDTHSISAGLDYPGVGPEHAWLRDSGRATYTAITDAEAMEALRLLCH